MKVRINLNTFALIVIVIFITMYSRVSIWDSYLSQSSVNIQDTDFLFFSHIEKNMADYENSLVVSFAEKVNSSFGVLTYFSDVASAAGVAQSMQLLLFFAIQITLGVIGIYMITRSLSLSNSETILVFLLFMFSIFTDFGRYLGGPGFYNKVIVSCFAISVGYIIIGLFLQGRMLASVSLSSLLIYLHPTYAFIFTSIILAYVSYHCFFIKDVSFRKLISLFLLPLIILLPFVINLLTTDISISGSGIQPIWWDFLKAKTSNPFPMQDGLIIVIPTLILFFITYRLLKKLKIKIKLESYSRASWVIGSIIFMWLVQIIFTELLPVSFIARLALTRITPFALLFMVIVFVVYTWRHRHQDSSGFWLLLLISSLFLYKGQLVPGDFVRFSVVSLNSISLFDFSWLLLIFGGYYRDFSSYPEILLLFLIVLMYLQYLNISNNNLDLIKYVKKYFYYCILFVGSYLVVCLLIKSFQISLVSTLSIVSDYFSVSLNILLNHPVNIFLYLLIGYWFVTLKVNTICSFKNIANYINERKSLVLLVIVSFGLVKPLYGSTLLLLSKGKEKTDIENMWNYIENYTNEGEMILVVPLSDATKYPVMPLRPTFIDGADAQYVLYDYELVSDVIERLNLIGMDLNRAMTAKRCAKALQYLDPMCRRKLFASLSSDYSDAWRKNIASMKVIAPNLSYVMLDKKYKKSSDVPIYESGELFLLSIDDLVEDEGV